MSIYYKYAPIYLMLMTLYIGTSEALENKFVDTLVNRFLVKLLGYVHWFMSIRILQMKSHSISVDQDTYATSIVDNYLDTATVKTISKFYKTTFPSDMIITKADASTSDEQVDKLTREFNIHYKVCIVSLIYLLSTRVHMSFVVNK